MIREAEAFSNHQLKILIEPSFSNFYFPIGKPARFERHVVINSYPENNYLLNLILPTPTVSLKFFDKDLYFFIIQTTFFFSFNRLLNHLI